MSHMLLTEHNGRATSAGSMVAFAQHPSSMTRSITFSLKFGGDVSAGRHVCMASLRPERLSEFHPWRHALGRSRIRRSRVHHELHCVPLELSLEVMDLRHMAEECRPEALPPTLRPPPRPRTGSSHLPQSFGTSGPGRMIFPPRFSQSSRGSPLVLSVQPKSCVGHTGTHSNLSLRSPTTVFPLGLTSGCRAGHTDTTCEDPRRCSHSDSKGLCRTYRH